MINYLSLSYLQCHCPLNPTGTTTFSEIFSKCCFVLNGSITCTYVKGLKPDLHCQGFPWRLLAFDGGSPTVMNRQVNRQCPQ